ncbi:MAG: hypothetical protein C0504_05220 [Candidatus Solibacter sp.]|nr:hypothetical protein [Candidatus Solibacter sp.]
MHVDAGSRRYRAWYGAMLRLYPRPFYERFGEAMEQTFQDLCRERRQAGRGVTGLAAWVYFETAAGIVKENGASMTEMRKTVARAAVVALVLLMAPIVGSRVVEGWNWGVGAFVFTYVMFFGTALAYGLIAGRMGAWAYKAAVGLALVSGFVMGWATMVHMSETENPVNLVYFGVLAVGAVGAWLARLKARGMARAMFAMAGALAVAFVITQVVMVDTPAGPVWDAGMRHGGGMALFAVSGLLFRRASVAEVK